LTQFIEWPEGYDPEVVKQWKPEARQKAADLLKDAKVEIQYWYCKRGRKCDGKPHEGYEYKHARGDQWPPPSNDPWMYWLLRGGRGSGKTRSGAEWTREMRKHAGRIAIIGPTAASVRDVQIEGESGLLFVCDRAGVRVRYEPSKNRLTFLDTGAIAHTYSAEEPDRLRGPQHGAGWLDEPAHYKNIDYVWSMFMYGLRLGKKPRVCLTTTPLPHEWLMRMIDDPRTRQSVVSTFANQDNLADFFLEEMAQKHAGTRLGRQELYGEILMDVEGALWNGEMIDAHREKYEGSIYDFALSMEKVVIAIDPAGTSTQRSDETGIIVVGALGDQGYVLADHSGKYKPAEWARKAVSLYDLFKADAIVVENNYGGEMVRSTLENISEAPRIREVNSRRGKFIRAEPIVALYEQGRVHHVGVIEKLENQLVSWVPGKGKSPDRLDALVHGLTDVMKISPPAEMATPKGIGALGPKGPFGYGSVRTSVR
jgi:phage terminase large subunit-like protein